MSLYLISATAAATLASDDPILPAASVGPLRDAAVVLRRAEDLRATAANDVAASAEQARAVGHAEGIAAGRAEAAEEAAEHLLALTAQATAERVRLRGDVSQLAVEVVRRIAGEIGAPAMVAALAGRAATDLLPDTVATVKVHPDSCAATMERLSGRPGLSVVADGSLAADDCMIETPLGISHAGLEIQLAAVERAWAAAVPEVANAG